MKKFTAIMLIFLIPVLVAVSSFVLIRKSMVLAVNSSDTQERLIEVAPEKTLSEICRGLSQQGLVRSCTGFKLLARILGIDTDIKAGEYMLNASMTPKAILQKLTRGEVFERRVTVKEGESIWAIGKLVEQAGLMPQADFEVALVDKSLLGRAGINGESFEGYLFPDTYQFSKPIKPVTIIWRMLEEGENRWTPQYTERAEQLKMSRNDVLTLASIIQKESGNVDEQPKVSSVFHNRLAQGMRLQSDPTVIYGVPNFDGNLTRAHLETVTPYNTYTNAGLPPGPICNPGDSAIKAALYPAETTYLFFVGDGKGSHVFSATLAEHNEAVRKYQILPNRAGR